MNYPPTRQGKDGESTPPPNKVASPSNIPSNITYLTIGPHGDYSKPHGPVQDQYHMGSYPQQLSQPPYSDRSQYPYHPTLGVTPQADGPPQQDHSQYPYHPTLGVTPQADGPPQQESSPLIEDRTPALKRNERVETTVNIVAVNFENVTKITQSITVDAVDNAGRPRKRRTYSFGQNQYPPGQREKSEVARHGENASQPEGAARSRYGGPRPEPYPHHMGSSMGPRMMTRGYGPNEMAVNLNLIQRMNADQKIDSILCRLKQRDQLKQSSKKAAEADQIAQKFANQFQQNAAQFGNRPVNNLPNQQQYSFHFQPMNAANIAARFPQFKNMPQSNMNIGGAQANFTQGYPRWNHTMTQNLSELYKQNLSELDIQAAQKAKFTTPNSEPVIVESETNEPEPSINTHSTVVITEIE